MVELIAIGQVEEGLIGLDPTDPAVTAVNCDRVTPRFDVCVITAIFRRCAAYITHVFDLDSVPDLRQLVDVPLLDDGTSARAHHRQIHHQSQALDVGHPGGRAVVRATEIFGVFEPLSAACPKPATRRQHLLCLLHFAN